MLIKQTDYYRIYSVINSLITRENGNPADACMYFSVFGAFLLKKHFKVSATPKSGLVAYRFDDNVMLFADHKEDGYLAGDGDNFHCWVEADGWAIDFMAPMFADNANGLPVPPKMFQKPLSDMAESVNALQNSGDFYYVPTPQASTRRFAHWKDNRAIEELVSVADAWFRKSPKKMSPSITVAGAKGEQTSIKLTGKALTGAW